MCPSMSSAHQLRDGLFQRSSSTLREEQAVGGGHRARQSSPMSGWDSSRIQVPQAAASCRAGATERGRREPSPSPTADRENKVYP